MSTPFLSLSPPAQLAALACLLAILFLGLKSRRSQKLPPGPPGLPLLGNLKQLAGKHWLTFYELQKKYGPLMYMTALGQPILIISSHKIASDLLDKRPRLYSDRPSFIVAAEILTGGMVMVVARSWDRWRRMRKAATEGLSKKVAQQLQPVQVQQTIILMQTLLEDSSNWNDLLRESTAILIFILSYGRSSKRADGLAALPQINSFVDRLVMTAYPGSHLADFFPWMVYLPSWMAKWKRDAEHYYKKDTEMFQGLYAKVEKLVAEGDNQSSFAATLIQQQDSHRLSNVETSWLSGTMYAAGTETTSGTISWFIFAMLLAPHIQRKAQEQLDAVVGRDRLPTFADQDKLTYLQAIIRETLRWNPVSPLGNPHRLTEDDIYEEYFIPKDTIILPNVWSMNRDTSVYGLDAHEFNPDRYLNEDGQIKDFPNTKGEGHGSWGFGNRLCVGRFVAKDSLYINVAFILWAFNIEPVMSSDGTPAIPPKDSSVNTGIIIKPPPFKCKFTPRFPEVASIFKECSEDF